MITRKRRHKVNCTALIMVRLTASEKEILDSYCDQKQLAMGRAVAELISEHMVAA